MRVLFSSTPGEGHIRPLLPLARELAARGQEVVFATAASWGPRLEELGFRSLAAGLEHAAVRALVWRDDFLDIAPSEVRLVLFPRLFGTGHAPAKLPDLIARMRDWQPDAIVYESADLAAPIAAAALDVPSVNHSFGAMIPRPVLERAADVVVPLWREHGLEPDPHAGAFGGLYVDICPPGLAVAKPLGQSVGLRPAQPAPGAPPPPGVKVPFIYATMGTIWNEPEFFRVLFEALGGLPAVVTTGRGSSAPEPVPKGVVVAEFLPQEDVLPHARAVVSHAGSGTMLGALAHGLPLVLVPQGADQFDNAEACERAGVAVVLIRNAADASSIRHALERVVGDPSFAEAAQRVAAEIAAMPSPDAVAAAVEEHAGAG